MKLGNAAPYILQRVEEKAHSPEKGVRRGQPTCSRSERREEIWDAAS
jgi:hypothetical protein